jgi:hypothetical protein
LYAVQASDVMPGNLWENLATRTTGGVWNTASGVVVTDDGENGNVYVTDAPAGPTDNERYIRLSIEEVID